MKLEMHLPVTYQKTWKSLFILFLLQINKSLGPLKGIRDLVVFITRKTDKGGCRQTILIIATLAFTAILFFTFLMQSRNLK